jgi:hypothetical protein
MCRCRTSTGPCKRDGSRKYAASCSTR